VTKPEKRTLSIDGRERSYLLYIPELATPPKAWPVVLAMHGSGVDAASMMSFCGLHEKADQAGFVAVFPNGSGRREDALTWNAGSCCGHAANKKVDDVGFFRALLDELARQFPLDATRVYATGMSAGGMMTYRLAVEIPERLAAIAPVCGPICVNDPPRMPMPVMHFHGTADEYAPFAGGLGPRSVSNVDFHSVEHTVQVWVKANGCPPVPTVSSEGDHVGDGTSITRKVYAPGASGADVVLYAIEGAGHTWPGRQPRIPVLGKSTGNLSANDMMWEFFQRHARPQ
jgi:polyhydroxybutyrate depolymerase